MSGDTHIYQSAGDYLIQARGHGLRREFAGRAE